MSEPLVYECQQSRQCAEEYVVEAIDYASEGEIYAATFSGHGAKERAEEYAAWKNATLPSEIQSPITDAAIDAAKPDLLGRRVRITRNPEHDRLFDPLHRAALDGTVAKVDAQDATGAYHVTSDDETQWAWYQPDELAPVAKADPLAGLPEAERLRIIGAATAAGIAARDACMAESQDADAARSAYGPAHHAALVREVAAYCAQKSAEGPAPRLPSREALYAAVMRRSDEINAAAEHEPQ